MIAPAGDVPAPGQMTRRWLVDRFGAPDSPGWSARRGGEDEEETFERTGSPTVMCWGSANEVVAELGDERAVPAGYFCVEGGTSIMSRHAEGHDLAIVDGRFLVDGWVAHVAEIGPCVLDLADPRDLAIARRLHEDFPLWTRRPAILDGTENEVAPEAPGYEMKEAA